jgi:membrane protein involved in colicin uptake
MSGINPTHKFLALIKEAEDFVANEKKLEAIQEAARVAAELKLKQEAEAKAAAELKAKQEADAKAAAELKAKEEADAKAAADQLAAEKLAASKAAFLKKTTITCLKGKLTKKVTAINPKCPTGYKKK